MNRIVDYPEATTLTDNDYVLIDNSSNGAKCIKASALNINMENFTINEASGSVASFDDGEELPLAFMGAYIEPQQDLHGYDNPWVGGSGKNKMPLIALSTQTKNGITFTPVYNGDSLVRIDVKGKKAIWGSIWYSLFNASITISQNMIMNGAQSGSNVRLAAFRVSAGSGDYIDTGNGVEIPTSAEQIVEIDIRVDGNADTQIDTSVYPMLRYATIADDSYAPYSNICPIIGWDEVNVTRCGKNLLAKAISNIGTTPSLSNCFYIKKGVYTLSYDCTSSHRIGIRVMDLDGNVYTDDAHKPSPTLYYNSSIQSYYGGGDTPSGSNNVVLTFVDDCYVLFNSNKYSDFSNAMFNFGNTALPYEPYNGHTYTIDLDGTRYGGTLDVVSGVLTVDRAYVDLGTLIWKKDSNELYTSDEVLDVPYRGASGLCGAFTVVPEMAFVHMPVNSLQILTNGIWVKSGKNYDDATAFKTAMNGVQLVYELATPLTIQLTPTPVVALEGENNISADSGNVVVAYRKHWNPPTM